MLRTSRLFYTFPKRTFYTPANFIFRSYSKKKMSEEQIDVCNEDGSSAGYAVSRSQIHAKGLWHRVVHTWIVNSKGELVLQLRSPNKESNPNKWDISSAGHISAGDESHISAMRELEEELGLTVPESDFKKLFSTKQQQTIGNYIDNELVDVYVITKDVDLSKLKLQKEEVSDVKYIHYTELEEMCKKASSSLVPFYHQEYAKFFDELRKKYT